jgi:hypothetical protein
MLALRPDVVSVNGARFEGKLDYLSAEADDRGQYTPTFSFDPCKTGLRARVVMQ